MNHSIASQDSFLQSMVKNSEILQSSPKLIKDEKKQTSLELRIAGSEPPKKPATAFGLYIQDY